MTNTNDDLTDAELGNRLYETIRRYIDEFCEWSNSRYYDLKVKVHKQPFSHMKETYHYREDLGLSSLFPVNEFEWNKWMDPDCILIRSDRAMRLIHIIKGEIIREWRG